MHSIVYHISITQQITSDNTLPFTAFMYITSNLSVTLFCHENPSFWGPGCGWGMTIYDRCVCGDQWVQYQLKPFGGATEHNSHTHTMTKTMCYGPMLKTSQAHVEQLLSCFLTVSLMGTWFFVPIPQLVPMTWLCIQILVPTKVWKPVHTHSDTHTHSE